MIESIMFFGGGFLVASLFGLVLISVVHHRAVRLTERRLADAIPVSMTEIQADKDNLRAEFAVSARRLEMNVEQLKAKATNQLGDIARKTEAINLLKSELAEKNAVTDELDATAKGLASRMRETEQGLEVKSADLAATQRALAVKEAELAKATNDINEHRLASDTHRVEIAVLKTQVEQFKSQVEELQHDVQESARRLFEERVTVSTVTKELEEKRQAVEIMRPQVAQLEREIAAATAELESRARRIGALETHNGEQEAELGRRAAEIGALQQHIATKKEEHAGTVRRLDSEKSALDVLLAAANLTVESHARHIEDIESRNREQQLQLARRENEISALQQDIAAKEAEHNAFAERLNDEKHNLESLLGAANNTVDMQAARIGDLESGVADRDRLLGRRDDEIRALHDHIAVTNEQHAAQVTATKDQHEAQVAATKEQHEAQVRALHDHIALTDEQHAAQVAATKEQHEAQVAATKEQHEAQVAATKEQHEAQVAATKEDHDARAQRWEADKDSLTRLLQTANHTLETRAARIADLEGWVAEWDEMLRERDAETNALHDQMAATKGDHNAQVQRWEADKDSLAKVLQSANHTLETRANRIADLEGWVAERDELLRERDAALTALTEEVTSARDGAATSVDRLRAEKAKLEGQLQVALEARNQAQIELTALNHEAEATWRAERVENALLRERINDIAAQVAHMVMTLDKEGPIGAILAESESPEPYQRAPDATDPAPEGSLTDRIRKLKNGASRAFPAA
jgi:chromosome segregation ATPase